MQRLVEFSEFKKLSLSAGPWAEAAVRLSASPQSPPTPIAAQDAPMSLTVITATLYLAPTLRQAL